VRVDTGDVRKAALGDRLHRLREAAGLAPAELADAAGLDAAYYRDVEAGRGDLERFTYLHLLRLADALAVPASAVLRD
jgi:transcriptional regulator with XRE-family HTH domain